MSAGIEQAAREFADDMVAKLPGKPDGLRGALQAAFKAGVEHDANIGRALRLDEDKGAPRGQVRARPSFLRDPSTALILRGRQLPALAGKAPTQMMVEIDVRKGVDETVSIYIEGRELQRMLADLYTIVVWNDGTGR